MFNNPLLGVAIGLIFFFLLLSIITTTLQELLATWLNLRGRNLMRALMELIRNDADRAKFFAQPHMFALFSGDLKERRPLQFMGDMFASLLTLNWFWIGGKRPGRMPAYLDPRSFAKAALGALDDVIAPGAAAPARGGAPAPASPTAGVGAAPTRGSAAALIAEHRAKGIADEGQILKELAELYTTTTERVSGWYKRQSQWIALLLGLVIATSVNADAIYIARQLWGNEAMRAGIVQAAQSFYERNQDKINQACALPTENADAAASEAARANCDKAFKDLGLRINDVTAAGYPIGWQDGGFLKFREGEGFAQALGIFLTALAISLGNNFWFDLLSKFLHFRGTGAKVDAM